MSPEAAELIMDIIMNIRMLKSNAGLAITY